MNAHHEKGPHVGKKVRMTYAERQRRTIQLCGDRISDSRERDRFTRMLTRAEELAAESKALRLAAWARYRALTGYEKGDAAGKYGKYA